MSRSLLHLLSLPLLAPMLSAQSSIRFDKAHQIWQMSAGQMTYALGINDAQELQTIYWGARLDQKAEFPTAKSYPELASFDPSVETTPLEYAGWGGGMPLEPALKVSFRDGNRSLRLVYADAKVEKVGNVEGDRLEITLRDITAPVLVHLFYRLYPEGILARWSTIENRGTEAITVEQASSATWNLPAGPKYELSWLTGRWGGEWQRHTEPLSSGARVLESRRGSTSHQSNPWFSLGSRSETTETDGPVWFGELGWSGSWRIVVEQTALQQVRITGGYNPFDFSYPLAPGESIETPIFYAGYTTHGEGEASRILHRFQRKEILPQSPQHKPRPVLFNSWEATEFDVNEAGQIALAEKAAKIGAERMVIDDGWFGRRNNDRAGLGDWTVNPTKFPHGLKPVIDRVHALGMDFGIWVEPEMVNPDSDLYRKHPEWAMNFPGRPRTEARNQLVLNLARDDVRQYIFGFLDKLVSENVIAFLKWDYNRNWSEPGWDAVPLDQQKKIYVRYVQNLYSILAELRKKHPKLEIESCSGGGGRVDLGILRYTDEVWPSDNTDALDRLTIQDGFTHAYSPNLMMAWVTDVPNFLDRRVIPLEFRFLVAMNGSLGIGGDLNKWTPEMMTTSARMVGFYKRVRQTVQAGELFRLISPVGSEQAATEYVSADGRQAVVFAMLHSQHFGSPFPLIRLAGLDGRATYRLTALDADKAPLLQAQSSGSQLMGEGLRISLRGDYDGTAILLERID